MLITISSSFPSFSELFGPVLLVLLVGWVLWMKGVPSQYMPWVMGVLIVLGGGLVYKNRQNDAERADEAERFTTLITKCLPAINFDAPKVPDSFHLDGKVLVSERETSETGKWFDSIRTFKHDPGPPTPMQKFMKEPFIPMKAEEPVAVVFLKIDTVETGRYSDSAKSAAITATISACLIQTSDQKVLGTMQFIGAPPESITVKTRRDGLSEYGKGSGEDAARENLANWLTAVTNTAVR